MLVGSYAMFAQILAIRTISWTKATIFSRNLALTTICGASHTRPTLFLHASRPCGAAQIYPKALQNVRRLFRARAPLPTRHQP